MSEQLPPAVSMGIGGIVMAAGAALWRALTAARAGEIAVYKDRLNRAETIGKMLGEKLDAERERREKAEDKLIEALTWIRARDPAAQWEELPTSVRKVMAATKDPFPELKGWDPNSKTPTGKT